MCWAAWHNTWLLIELTPKGVVFSFLFSNLTIVFSFPFSNLTIAAKQAVTHIVLFDDSLSALFWQPHAKNALPRAKRPALKLCCCALQASRPKLALWRSARERGIWMRDMAAAQVSTSAAEVAYLAAVLSDK